MSFWRRLNLEQVKIRFVKVLLLLQALQEAADRFEAQLAEAHDAHERQLKVGFCLCDFHCLGCLRG